MSAGTAGVDEAWEQARLPLWYLRRRPHYLGGNEVLLHRGGDELFPAMLAAIARARHEIWLASYIFHTDASAQAVAQALSAAARRGVRVRVVVDGFGSLHALEQLNRWWQGMGVAWVVFRPLDRWWSWLQPEHLRRMHQKLCAVDGEVGFVGGINIIDDRIDLGHGRQDTPRLDYAVEVRGPVVEPLTQTVRAMWTRAAFGVDWRDEMHALLKRRHGMRTLRRRLARMRLPPHSPGMAAGTRRGEEASVAGQDGAEGESAVAFLLRDNLRQRHSILATLLQALSSAREAVDIACPYFYPGRSLRRALLQAAGRGVKVRLLLQGRIDYRFAGMAASVLYRELLSGGVRIFEYTPAFLHAKVVRVDGRWATVGSSNIDPLSLLVNFEANVAIRDEAFVRELAVSLESAFAQSREITAPPPVSRWRTVLRRTLVSAAARLYLRLAGVRSSF